MTRDFRQFGPVSTVSAEIDRPAAPNPVQRIVVRVLYASAAVFLGLGLWILLGVHAWLPPEIVPFLGGILILVAVSDVMVARLFMRFWARQVDRAKVRVGEPPSPGNN